MCNPTFLYCVTIASINIIGVALILFNMIFMVLKYDVPQQTNHTRHYVYENHIKSNEQFIV